MRMKGKIEQERRRRWDGENIKDDKTRKKEIR